MTVSVLLGAGLGLGMWALVVWLFPPRPSLAAALATTRPVASDALRVFALLGLPTGRQRRDLRLLERTTESFLTSKAVFAVLGLLLPNVMQMLVWLVGAPLPWQVPVVGSIGIAAGGFLLPDLDVRRQAQRKRASFRHALGAYLNLVRVLLAGGAGVDGALTDAASIGQGWTFSCIRRALTTARLTRTTPWVALRQLGDELDVRELIEVSSSVSLAGTEGAKVRASLAAKAAAMRTHELTEAEGAAQAATERMSMPVMCLFAGFLLFIGYPAMETVLSNF
jgi:Flp pilus assembly protein TadB